MRSEGLDGDITTRSGFRFTVRRARPDDEGTLADFFTHVTAEDVGFRFLSGMQTVPHERLIAMVRSDNPQTSNFLAFSLDGKLVAVAMLASDLPERHAEVAMSIRADHKHMGVSWELLRHVAHYAEKLGFETIESIENRENHEAIELERDMGFTVTAYPDDMSLVLVRKHFASNSIFGNGNDPKDAFVKIATRP